ncbi:unnamed protein product [Medioppia subpectinata]|uniref:Nose resistant-to-fluoxetine protein N-terminal domain-containing protein n=1 Tax=Medioppia subpectinata TaxID=1979941 RepID=A0A7R9KD52_9ACAR|nr:unnamed protein product [Medioppia subpectinata]CAG2101243.1 unnamed protein product [Medioppia subpectinata]
MILDAQPSFQMTVTELGGPSIGNYDQCLSIVSPEEVDQPVIKGQYCSMDTNFILDIKMEDVERSDNLGAVMNKSVFANNFFPGLMGVYVPIIVSRDHNPNDLTEGMEYSKYFFKKDIKLVNGFCLPTTCKPEDLSDAINESKYLRLLPMLVAGVLISLIYDFLGDVSNSNMLKFPNTPRYSSADFQLYALSPLAFLALYKMPRFGVLWNVFLLAIGVSIPLITRFHFNVPHIYEGFSTDSTSSNVSGFTYHYWSSLPYFQTYIVGILAGYAIRRHPKAYLGGRIGETIISLVTFSMTFGICWWNKDFLHFSYRYTRLNGYELHVYLLVHKVFYLSGFCWLFYACATGRAVSNSNMLKFLNTPRYSSADFQLYALSPLAFLALYKMPRFGVLWNVFLLAIGISIPLITRFHFNIPHIYEGFSTDSTSSNVSGFTYHYWSSLPYFQTYIIGILAGYAIRRHPKAYLGGRIGETIISLATFSMTFGICWWNKDFLHFSYRYTRLNGYELHVYLLVHKVFYLSGFCWLFYACATGRAEFLIE